MSTFTHPDWVSSIGPKMHEVLFIFDKIRKEFYASNKDGYKYQYVTNIQVNEILQRVGRGERSISGRDYLAWLYSQGASIRMISLLNVTKQMTIAQLLDSTNYGLNNGSLVIIFGCLRGILEHTAHFEAALSLVRDSPDVSDYQEALKILPEIQGGLVSLIYGTRTDWNKLTLEEIEELLVHNKLQYISEPGFQDRKSKSCLTMVDALDKRIKGVRGAYEILCEFVHPNVGALFSFTKEANSFKDDQDICWIKKEISLGPPLATINSCRSVFELLFIKIAECLEHSRNLVAETHNQNGKLLKYVQILIKHRLQIDKVLISPYIICPCGSGDKIKFCCGQKID